MLPDRDTAESMAARRILWPQPVRVILTEISPVITFCQILTGIILRAAALAAAITYRFEGLLAFGIILFV